MKLQQNLPLSFLIPSIAAFAINESEYNNSMLSADTIKFGDKLSGSISSNGDEDYAAARVDILLLPHIFVILF